VIARTNDAARETDDLRQCIWWACALEATAPKPGNVSPLASFPDLCYEDFLRSANVVAPLLAEARQRGVGRTIYEAIRATQDVVGRNTNLGIVLLLAPLAAVDPTVPLDQGIESVLNGLTVEDAGWAYQAIRLAAPGGMGRVSAEDLSATPTRPLREIMRLAADRDTIAREYASGFSIVLRFGVWALGDLKRWLDGWDETIVGLHLVLMARFPDTLIARKSGRLVAREAARHAQAVLDAGWPHTPKSQQRLRALDAWLRADGHRRNPGTTADLVTACLFAAFRDRRMELPDLDDLPLDLSDS